MSDPEVAAGETQPPLPPWEQRWPGRLQWELDWLKYFGANPQVDQEALLRGVVHIDLEWKVAGERVQLHAEFPDSYPHLRPQVRLRGGASSFQRHVAPGDGTICLIGRDARQWSPDLGLARLLDEQLEKALTGTGEEDPQAEPSEFWWNACSAPSTFSFVLVETAWDLSGHDSGYLDIRYVASGKPLTFRGFVERVLDTQKRVIATWTSMLPPEQAETGSTVRIQWVRTGSVLAPLPDWPDLQQLIGKNGPFPNSQHAGTRLGRGFVASLYAIIHPTELTHDHIGDGWLFALVDRGEQRIHVVPTFRAGEMDIGERVPAVQHLRGKTVAMVGLGAVGAPAALELARNGCSTVRLLEPDRVEPGNSIRWPLGTSAWGRQKVFALQEFIEREYGWCKVECLPFAIGDVSEAGAEEARLAQLLGGAHIVIDGSANQGVTALLGEHCRSRALPLIALWATPPVTGGIVARFAPESGCPVCLEHHHFHGTIERPPGYAEEGALLQPAACSERTFTGSSTDLQELSLEAARLAIASLGGKESASLVETLALVDAAGNRVPPQWRSDELAKHADCLCSQ